MAIIDKLYAIADAIREKTGVRGLMTMDDMVEHIRNIETSSGGDFSVDSMTMAGNNSTSLSFSGLKGEPKAFEVHYEDQHNASNTRVVTTVFYDGTVTHGTWDYQQNNRSWGINYHSTSYFDFSYSNGTLTVRTSSSSNGGVFRSGGTYRLTYFY